MNDDRYAFEPLEKHHDRTAFSCGVEALDRYLHHQAGQDTRKDLAAVFVLHDRIQHIIVGYYTLSALSIEPSDLPAAVTRSLSRYPLLPAALLGRLAIDDRYQGQCFGGLLLIDALQRCLRLRSQIAAMAVVVDAKDAAARGFYERYGFQRFLNREYRLYLPMATIAQSFPPEATVETNS